MAKIRSLPITTIVVVVIIAIVSGLQFVYPVILETLRRNPAAFAAGQWWRLLSPLLVHADGPWALVFNSIGMVLVGPSVERVFGGWCWLALFLIGGLVGNITGYAWDPYGAGLSVGMFGLIGGLFAWLLMRNEQVWPVALAYTMYIIANLIGHALGWNNAADLTALGAAIIVSVVYARGGSKRAIRWSVAAAGLLGGLVLTALSNNHGPPIIAGACLGALFVGKMGDARQET